MHQGTDEENERARRIIAKMAASGAFVPRDFGRDFGHTEREIERAKFKPRRDGV